MTTPDTNDAINELIESAINLLNEDTWCRGGERYDGEMAGTYQYCAIGALKEATGAYNWAECDWESDEAAQLWYAAYVQLNRTVRAQDVTCNCGYCCEPIGNIVAYNDAGAESVEDVKLMMKRAIET